MKQFKKRLPDIGLLLFSFFIIVCTFFAGREAVRAFQPLVELQPVASGTLGAGNLTVNLVNGAANIFIPSGTPNLSNYRGGLLMVTETTTVDSVTRTVQGYIDLNATSTTANIFSTQGGAVQNWASSPSGFLGIGTLPVSYNIFQGNFPLIRLVASGSIAAGQSYLDTTTAGALYDGSVDLSAYRNGKYKVCFTNTVGGYTACAYISATAPTGETLDANRVTGWTNSGGYPFSTFTSSGADITSAITTTGGGASPNSNFSETHGQLMKLTVTLTSSKTYTAQLKLSNNSTWPVLIDRTATSGVYTQYHTVAQDDPFNTFYLYAAAGDDVNFSLTGFYYAHVQTPVSTGAYLLSTRGGSRGWLSKNANFDPTTAMTYAVYYVGK